MFSNKKYYRHLETSIIGRKISCLEEVSSTNDYLLDGDAVAGDAVVAYMQTKGRGRNGRSWCSSEHALLFSFVLPVDDPMMLMPVNIIAGYAVVEALRLYADVYLKWPNDCMVGGKKVCGMLIDSRFSGSMLTKAVIGIGINVFKTDFHADIAHRATSLELCKTSDSELSKERIAASIFNIFESLLAKYNKSEIDIKSLFPYYSANVGKMITVHRSGKLVRCIEQGINEDGTLIVTLENGETDTISTGEIGYDFNG